MKHPICFFLIASALSAINPGMSHGGPIDIPPLVDQFKAATDLQRQEIRKNTFNKEAAGRGLVSNVDDYDLYDETNDIRWKYYRVTTEVQNSANGNPYRIIVLYKDRNKVKDINRGWKMEASGNVMKIDDEHLQIAVLLHDGTITPAEERVLRY